MKGFLCTLTAISVVVGSKLIAAEAPPAITVFVYNYAAVPAPTLDEARRQAASIYRQASVDIEWLDCPLSREEAPLFPACQIPPGPTRLALRILPQHMTKSFNRPPHSFGFALFPEDGGFANVANVFAHRAHTIATRHRVRRAVILGHLIAHELGHLLLGENSHFHRGIMLVPWRRAEIQQISWGRMGFTRGQARKMRDNIRARASAAVGDQDIRRILAVTPLLSKLA